MGCWGDWVFAGLLGPTVGLGQNSDPHSEWSCLSTLSKENHTCILSDTTVVFIFLHSIYQMLQLLTYSYIYLFGTAAKYVALEKNCLDLNTSSATYKLCDLGPR